MSIQSQIERLFLNVSNAKQAIRDRGVVVADTANSDDLASLIGMIPEGSKVYKIEVTDAVSSNGGKTVEYDITPYYSMYADITIDNIVVQLPGIRQVANLSSERVLSVTYAYEPTSGILSISSTAKIWSSSGTQTFDIFIIEAPEVTQLKDYLGLKGVADTDLGSVANSYTYTFNKDFAKCLVFVTSARTGTINNMTHVYDGNGNVEILVVEGHSMSSSVANIPGVIILQCENIKSGESITFSTASNARWITTILETE